LQSSVTGLSTSIGTLETNLELVPGVIDEKIAAHNQSETAHANIRDDISDLGDKIDLVDERLTAFLADADTTQKAIDTLKEI
jgi:hypothetical protein